MELERFFFRVMLVVSIAALLLQVLQYLLATNDAEAQEPVNHLIGRAILPVATFAPGPTSGSQLGAEPLNGQ